MQDRYAGDERDYFKIGLLCVLAGQDLPLGVIWYLNPYPEPNQDGGRTEYSSKRVCDPKLYNALQRVLRGNRCVEALEHADIFPRGTIFYRKPLPLKEIPPWQIDERVKARDAWLVGASGRTANAALLFLDPDNGIAPETAKAHDRFTCGLNFLNTDNGTFPETAKKNRRKSVKYAFLDEVEKLWCDGKHSLVIYQQAPHKAGWLDYKLAALAAVCKKAEVWVIMPGRKDLAFLVVAAKNHRKRLLDRTKAFVNSPWGQNYQARIVP